MIFIHYQEKVNACEILGLIILLVGLFMLMNGLLEAFPTEEQIEKVRMCGWLFTGVGGIWESICLINWPLHTRDFSRELSGFSCIIGMRMV